MEGQSLKTIYIPKGTFPSAMTPEECIPAGMTPAELPQRKGTAKGKIEASS
ncbi:hypothetical protein [Candidatus Formimonas warabiya]|uniref:hypothetical protein n=1 Tax=Formimonas warabiya TaxID=1761012 RepID=UPI001BE44B24|nr:hypothetical protein [Candidatus Formimonas warabiya]